MKQYKYSNKSIKIHQFEANFICRNYGKLPVKVICKKLKIGKSSINNILKLNNIKLKPNGWWCTGRSPTNKKVNLKKIKYLYFKKKLSIYEIAKKLKNSAPNQVG